jgi:signal peptidase II
MTTPPGGAGDRGATHGHIVVLAVVAVVVLALDLLTKELALDRLVEGRIVPLVPGLLALRLVFNPGAAFSFATGATWIFTIIAVGVVVVVARVAPRLGSRTWAVALGMLLGGAVGNLADRLARPPGFGQGHVVDFIDYAGLFVGNVADIAIVGAAVLIGWLAVRGVAIDGTRQSRAPRPAPGPDGAAGAPRGDGERPGDA